MSRYSCAACRWRADRAADVGHLRVGGLALGTEYPPAEIDRLCHLFVGGIQRERDRLFHRNEVFADTDCGAVGARDHALVAAFAWVGHCPVLLPGRHGLVWLDRALLVFIVVSRL